MIRTKKRNSSATDRISNLPGSIIDDILKHLPLCDAVRTSILSKQWRDKWITIPYIVFEEEFIEKLPGKYNIESIVNQVLLIHKGPLAKFKIEIGSGLNNCRPVVHFLANHCIDSIEEVTLGFPYSAIHKRIPDNLFSLNKLKILHLYHCTLRPPPEFRGFGRLHTIVLSNVATEPGDLREFISKCPLIRNLDLENIGCNTFGDLEIDAPNLETFGFWFLDRIPSIYIKHTELLEEVSLVGTADGFLLNTSQKSQSNLIKFFGQLSSITKLTLDYDSLQLFARVGVARKFPSKFSHLLELELIQIDFGKIDELTYAVCLITSFPTLSSLEIESSPPNNVDVKPAVGFLKTEQQNCKLTYSHLEYVEIDRFSGSAPEMEFVKLILSRATVLVTLKLKCDLKDAANEESRMFKELARFRRASPKAEIIIT